MRPTRLPAIAALLCATLAVQAGGVRELAPLTVARLTEPIALDGDLREWGHLPRLFTYVPLRTEEKVSPEVAEVLEQYADSLGQRVELWAAYDDQALYLGLLWVNPMYDRGSAGLGVYLLTDRLTRIECWPGAAGETLRLTLQGAAFSGPGLPPPAALPDARLKRYDDERRFDLEIMLPWSELTTTGQPAEARVFFDFIWSGLGPDFLAALPPALVHPNCAFSFNFLTAEAFLGATGDLPDPASWGTLVFSGTEADDREVHTPPLRSATCLAVPRAPGPIAIDGALDDWADVSKRLTIWAPDFLGTRYGAALALCYDDRALYLALIWSSVFPMFNMSAADLGQGHDGGDCLQFRVQPTGRPPTSYYGWYDTLGRRPVLTREPERDLDLLRKGPWQAFMPDPFGYIQELMLPWSLVTAEGQPPAPGEKWPASFRLWWAGLDSRFAVSTQLRLQPADP